MIHSQRKHNVVIVISDDEEDVSEDLLGNSLPPLTEKAARELSIKYRALITSYNRRRTPLKAKICNGEKEVIIIDDGAEMHSSVGWNERTTSCLPPPRKRLCFDVARGESHLKSSLHRKPAPQPVKTKLINSKVDNYFSPKKRSRDVSYAVVEIDESEDDSGHSSDNEIIGITSTTNYRVAGSNSFSKSKVKSSSGVTPDSTSDTVRRMHPVATNGYPYSLKCSIPIIKSPPSTPIKDGKCAVFSASLYSKSLADSPIVKAFMKSSPVKSKPIQTPPKLKPPDVKTTSKLQMVPSFVERHFLTESENNLLRCCAEEYSLKSYSDYIRAFIAAGRKPSAGCVAYLIQRLTMSLDAREQRLMQGILYELIQLELLNWESITHDWNKLMHMFENVLKSNTTTDDHKIHTLRFFIDVLESDLKVCTGNVCKSIVWNFFNARSHKLTRLKQICKLLRPVIQRADFTYAGQLMKLFSKLFSLIFAAIQGKQLATSDIVFALFLDWFNSLKGNLQLQILFLESMEIRPVQLLVVAEFMDKLFNCHNRSTKRKITLERITEHYFKVETINLERKGTSISAMVDHYVSMLSLLVKAYLACCKPGRSQGGLSSKSKLNNNDQKTTISFTSPTDLDVLVSWDEHISKLSQHLMSLGRGHLSLRTSLLLRILTHEGQALLAAYLKQS